MAASHLGSVRDQMADMIECTICTEVYTNPKILPCVHTFCLQCLERYGGDKKTGDQMACPICRGEFLIPDGGLCKLPYNFFIEKMVNIRKLSQTSTEELKNKQRPWRVDRVNPADGITRQEVASVAVSILTKYSKELQDVKTQIVDMQAKINSAIETFKKLS